MKRLRYEIPNYVEKYDHTKWEEHKTRVRMTLELASKYVVMYGCETLVDLSCGDGTIPLTLASSSGITCIELGDRVDADHITLVGPIEETIKSVQSDAADLFICTETLEHLDNPASILRDISYKTDYILITTPIDETLDHGNPEHLWSWSAKDLKSLVTLANFAVLHYTEFALDFYTYGFIWAQQTNL